MRDSIATAKAWGALAGQILRLNVATGFVCTLMLLLASPHAVSVVGASSVYVAISTLPPVIAGTLAAINIYAWSRRHLSVVLSLYSAFIMMSGWMATIVLQTIFGYHPRWNDTMHTQQLSSAHGISTAMVAYYLKLAAAGLAMLLQFGQLLVSARAVHAKEQAEFDDAIVETPQEYRDEE